MMCWSGRRGRSIVVIIKILAKCRIFCIVDLFFTIRYTHSKPMCLLYRLYNHHIILCRLYCPLATQFNINLLLLYIHIIYNKNGIRVISLPIQSEMGRKRNTKKKILTITTTSISRCV